MKLVSRFVLEVLPYLLLVLAAIVLLPGIADSLIAAALPGIVSSPPHGMETMTELNDFSHDSTVLDVIREDHESFEADRYLHEIAKAAEDKLARH